MGGPSGPPCFEYSTLSYAQLLRASPALGRWALRLPVAQGGSTARNPTACNVAKTTEREGEEVSAGESDPYSVRGFFSVFYIQP